MVRGSASAPAFQAPPPPRRLTRSAVVKKSVPNSRALFEKIERIGPQRGNVEAPAPLHSGTYCHSKLGARCLTLTPVAPSRSSSKRSSLIHTPYAPAKHAASLSLHLLARPFADWFTTRRSIHPIEWLSREQSGCPSQPRHEPRGNEWFCPVALTLIGRRSRDSAQNPRSASRADHRTSVGLVIKHVAPHPALRMIRRFLPS